MKPAAGTEKVWTSLAGDQDDKQDNLEPVLPFDRELDIMNVPARGCRAESDSHVNEGGCCVPLRITKHLWMGLCFLGAHAACYKNFCTSIVVSGGIDPSLVFLLCIAESSFVAILTRRAQPSCSPLLARRHRWSWSFPVRAGRPSRS
jgi:hypothetical protein